MKSQSEPQRPFVLILTQVFPPMLQELLEEGLLSLTLTLISLLLLITWRTAPSPHQDALTTLLISSQDQALLRELNSTNLDCLLSLLSRHKFLTLLPLPFREQLRILLLIPTTTDLTMLLNSLGLVALERQCQSGMEWEIFMGKKVITRSR